MTVTVEEWWDAIAASMADGSAEDDSVDSMPLEYEVLEHLQTCPLPEALTWVREALLQCPPDIDWLGWLSPLVEHVAYEDGMMAVEDAHPLHFRYGLMSLILSGHKEFDITWQIGDPPIMDALEARNIKI